MTEFLSRLLDTFLTHNVGEVSSFGMNKVVLGRPSEKLWFIDNRKYWERDQDCEMRAHSRSTRSLVSDGWNNVEVHTMTFWRRSTYSSSFPNWWDSLEPSRHLVV